MIAVSSHESPSGNIPVRPVVTTERTGEFSFADLVKLIRRRWLIILAGLLATLIVTMSFWALASRIYSARTLIKFDEIAPVLDSQRKETLRSQNQGEGYLQTKLTELKNLPLANRVLSNPNVGELFALYYGDKKSSSADEGVAGKIPTNILRKYLNLTNVEQVAETTIVSIEARTLNPELSAAIADNHAKEFIAMMKHQRQESDRDVKAFLKGQEEELRQKLATAERELSEFANSHDIIDLGNEKLASNRYEAAQKLLQDAEAKTLKAKADLERAQATKDVDSALLDDPTVTGLRTQVRNKRAEVDRLLEKYAPGYPAVRELNSEIASLEKQIVDQRKAVLDSQESSYLAAQNYEKELREQVKKESVQARKTGLHLGEYGRLKQDHDSLKKVYDDVVIQLRQLEVSSLQGSGVNIAVVEPASVPVSPSSPKLHLFLLLGSLIGLVVGFGAASLAEFFDLNVRDPEETEQMLPVPGLAVLPHFDVYTAASEASATKTTPIKAGVPEAGVPETGLVQSTGFVSIDSPFSVHGEAFRDLRAAVRLSSIDKKAQIILVSSALPEEGKSTVAANLAAAFAQDGFSTLLIDGDLRKPSLNRFFSSDIHASIGLSDILTGQAAFEEVLITSSRVKNLSFLPAGSPAPNPAELAGSRRMENLLQQLRMTYDFIILDSSPVGTVSDAIILSPSCDGVVIVARENQTPKRALLRSIIKLQSANARVLGFVYNGLRYKRGLIPNKRLNTPVYAAPAR
jgi:capsular exopolysaccharide synthesis family protein